MEHSIISIFNTYRSFTDTASCMYYFIILHFFNVLWFYIFHTCHCIVINGVLSNQTRLLTEVGVHFRSKYFNCCSWPNRDMNIHINYICVSCVPFARIIKTNTLLLMKMFKEKRGYLHVNGHATIYFRYNTTVKDNLSASNYISLYLWDVWGNYYSYLSVRWQFRKK